MKKTYISPALTVYSLYTESDMLGLTMSADSGSTGNTVNNDTEESTHTHTRERDNTAQHIHAYTYTKHNNKNKK